MTSKQIQELIECGLLNYDDRLPKLAQTALDALQRVEMQSLRIKELEAYVEGTKEGMDAYVKSRDAKSI
ncbi:MAG: hypothetical protein IPL32_19015 [Chloracidobacterium sp.]|nr:hypothetical protein [Chloracidobacterium sp.]